MKSIYLVAYYFQKPAQRVRTNKPGWMENRNNLVWDEQVAVTRNLKNRDLTTAKIILDLGNKRVLKNDWLNNRNFDDLFTYFSKGYPQYTKEVMQQLDPGYLNPVSDSAQLGVDGFDFASIESRVVEPPRVVDTSGSSLAST